MKKSLIFLLTLFSIISFPGYDFENNYVSAEQVYMKNYSKDKKSLDFEVNDSRIFLNTRFAPKAKVENPAKKNNWFDNFEFLKFIPYVLGIIGLFILFLFVKYLSRSSEEFDDFNFEEEVPIFHSKISEDEYKSYESLNKKHFKETDEPFEVVWKQNAKR